MDPAFDRYGDALFSGSGLPDPSTVRGRVRQRTEHEQEADFYAHLMVNQQDLGRHRGLDELHVPYFDPVRDRFDDSYLADASGDRHLMETRMFSDPGDPMGTRSRLRRRELEDEILPDIGPMDRHVLGLPPDEGDVRRLARMREGGPLDIGLIDAMGGANAPRRYPDIRDVDFDFIGPPPLRGHRLGASYDERFLPREVEAELYMRSLDRTPRGRRSLSITSGFELPSGARSDPRMPRDVRMEDQLMGSPEANMLLGARPLLDRGGTPMPDIGLQEPMLPPRRNRRW